MEELQGWREGACGGCRCCPCGPAHVTPRWSLLLVQGSELTAALTRVAEEFGVKGLTGTLSHKMKRCVGRVGHTARCRSSPAHSDGTLLLCRFMIDGGDCVHQVSDKDTKVEEVEFAVGDVYQLDVCMTTGQGKVRGVLSPPPLVKYHGWDTHPRLAAISMYLVFSRPARVRTAARCTSARWTRATA